METTWELYEMFQALLQAPGYHLALELFLILWLLWLLLHKSYQPDNTELTAEEKESLISEWMPEALVPKTPEDHYALKPRIVKGKLGKNVMVDGKICLNAATHNYLGFVENPDLEKEAIIGLRKYGVGSCGPRGFFGTVDIHLDLEQALADFMGVEESVLYSYGFAAISSAIPAYSKQGDIIFCDEGVSFAIQKGLVASRSQIRFFKHNDMEDLERLFMEQVELDHKNPRKAKVTLKFLVVEGLYMNHGDICPLPKLIELKSKYKVRLFIDESCSFGVLGKNGRGVTEHFGIPVDEVDLIVASLENAMASYGGFCCGSSYIVDHQRLSGLGYCFSASLPPLQAAVALAALKAMKSNPEVLVTLRENASLVHKELQRIPQLSLGADEISPVKHLYIVGDYSREEKIKKLERIVDYGYQNGIAFTVARYLDKEEHTLLAPSIRLVVNSLFEEADVKRVADVLRKACEKIL
ncbi:serine palmitoyltransferase 1-like [Centruroides sculpturatus]|uniref:serine palmitoyltransferase 1-like n=1 Tax=Centruroides sculpturatus TaxID=218467 RepID=UPI000C6CA972|nr:serine palmitoyltransferase 1-like [Centruroides sculpturatus]